MPAPSKVVILHDASALAGGASAVLAEMDALREKGLDIILFTWDMSPSKFIEEATIRGTKVYTYPGKDVARMWRTLGLPLLSQHVLERAHYSVRNIIEKLSSIIDENTLIHVHHSRLEPFLTHVRERRGGIWVKTIHSAFYVCPLQATPGTKLGHSCRGYWLDGSSVRCIFDALSLGVNHPIRLLRGTKRLKIIINIMKILYDRIISPSKFLANMLKPVINSNKITVIRNPLPRDEWLFASRLYNIKKEPYALFMGRLAREKGIEDLESIAIVLNKMGIRLVVAGDGPLRNIVEQLASKDLVTYLGYVWGKHKYSLLARASILVFPSHAAENMPMTIAEAIAFSTPIATYNIGGQRELVDESGCGTVVRAFNAEELAMTAAKLARSPLIIKACREWARRELSPKEYVKRLLSAILENTMP